MHSIWSATHACVNLWALWGVRYCYPLYHDELTLSLWPISLSLLLQTQEKQRKALVPVKNGVILPSSANCRPGLTSCLVWRRVTIELLHRERFRLREEFVEMPQGKRKRYCGVFTPESPKIQIWTREETWFWDSPWAFLYINMETSAAIKL